MASEAILEELEVLESIYPEEISKLSDRDIELVVEPDNLADGAEDLKVTLCVHYSDEYPDVLPGLSLKPLEGAIDNQELASLLESLRSVGNDNLGMAMTFTLMSHLREQLSQLMSLRAERREREENEKERLALEEEEARTRGTPVTIESFNAWKAAFDREIAMKRAREEEEKMKGLTPKEREEFKRLALRLTGRQLFERGDRNLEDDTLLEEGTVSVDASQYDREEVEEEQEDEGVTFSDSE